MNKQGFLVTCVSDKIWNMQPLVHYLAKNTHGQIDLQINPEAICFRNLGLYDLLDCFEFDQVNLYTSNPLESHDRYNIVYVEDRTWLAQQPAIPKEILCWTGLKKFLAFYHRPTANRLGLASYLFSHYGEQSLIHFNHATDLDHLQLFEFEKLALFRSESLGEAAALMPSLPLHGYTNPDIDEKLVWINNYHRDNNLIMYRDIFVDIVSESHVAGTTFYCTEKTVRPMWCLRPFIAFASKNYLDHLHQMGFLTFNDFWSEDYDGYEGRDRFLKILQVIDTLANMSTADLQDMYTRMLPVLEHNRNLLTTQTYRLENVTHID